MESLFDTNENKLIIERIEMLLPDSKAVWGKMTVSQMLAHSQVPLHVATGKLKLKRNLIGILFGKMAKNSLMKPKPFSKNLPTAPEFIVKKDKIFDTEKAKLIELLSSFLKAGPSSITKEPHPFFGVMTAHEWDKLQWKHIDHHLRQFGV